jgi:hypothetical protein
MIVHPTRSSWIPIPRRYSFNPNIAVSGLFLEVEDLFLGAMRILAMNCSRVRIGRTIARIHERIWGVRPMTFSLGEKDTVICMKTMQSKANTTANRHAGQNNDRCEKVEVAMKQKHSGNQNQLTDISGKQEPAYQRTPQTQAPAYVSCRMHARHMLPRDMSRHRPRTLAGKDNSSTMGLGADVGDGLCGLSWTHILLILRLQRRRTPRLR